MSKADLFKQFDEKLGKAVKEHPEELKEYLVKKGIATEEDPGAAGGDSNG